MKTLIAMLGMLVFAVLTVAWRISGWWDRRREKRIQDFVNRACDQAKVNLDWERAEAACRDQKEKQWNVRARRPA